MEVKHGNVTIELDFTLWRSIVQERIAKALEQREKESDDKSLYALASIYAYHASHIISIDGMEWHPLEDGVGTPEEIEANYLIWLKACDREFMNIVTDAMTTRTRATDPDLGPSPLPESADPKASHDGGDGK